MSDTTQALEERIAYLERTVEDLSDVIARQDSAMEQLVRQVAMLMQREATREADAGGGTYFADETPPHY
ncbi:SlyX family protein [Pacificoceanicola onchidii]|uniref:SlyX family protein n=1 Tax=Pacificoceanicola onchidii TaxID=2562685 RepID=UPI0010A6657F|nr:SlyX family protein [Pacificoceanicola onchidii]